MIATDMSARKLADEAIGLFLEYRDVHGYDEAQARLMAAGEVQQGVDAEQELRAAGELPVLPLPLPGPKPRGFGFGYPEGDTAEQGRADAAERG